MVKHSNGYAFLVSSFILLNYDVGYAHQGLSDAKKPGIAIELQKLVSEWPLEVTKHQKEDHKMVCLSLEKNLAAIFPFSNFIVSYIYSRRYDKLAWGCVSMHLFMLMFIPSDVLILASYYQ